MHPRKRHAREVDEQEEDAARYAVAAAAAEARAGHFRRAITTGG